MRNLYTMCLAVSLCCDVAFGATKFPLIASTTVPGARGQVDIGKDKNGNLKVSMKVEHLANPESLTPASAVYVVWLQEKGGTAENLGQLKVDKKETAKFETVTPSKTFDLFVTGERDAGAKTPGGTEVLRTTVQP